MNKMCVPVMLAVMGICLCAEATLIESFEDGLSGLDYSGSLSLTGSLGPLLPTDGSAFALLTNGPGDVGADLEPDFSFLTIDFPVGPDDAFLLFDYDFLTGETTSLNGGPFAFDFFTATLESDILVDALELLRVDTEDTFSYLLGPDVFVEAPDGSLFDQETGLNSFKYPGLNAFAGETVSLVFEVGDEWDGSFDSGVFLDNVRAEPRVVPEPATLTLIGGGLLGMLILYARDHKNSG